MYEKQESGRGRKVQRQGLFSGIRPDGQPWPEVLIGAEEIGGYLRLHAATVRRMIRGGRLPAEKDSRRRWRTTKNILEKWMLRGMKLQALQREERQRAAHLIREKVAAGYGPAQRSTTVHPNHDSQLEPDQAAKGDDGRG